MTERASPLARYLLLAYALLVIYASLHPFSGWRDLGVAPLDFLYAAPPRRLLLFDSVANVLGYAPLGFLAVLALYPWLRGTTAFLVASFCAASLSFGLEALQTYLPSRTPSNIDFYANSAGGALGALLALPAAVRLLREDAFHAVRYRLFRPGRAVDMGLVLLGLWLLTQLNAETLLFGNGDLRELLDAPLPGEQHAPGLFIRVEAFVAGANIVAVGLMLALLVEKNGPVRMLFLGLVVAALAVRTLAFAVFFKPPNMMLWLTPGAMLGAAGGVVIVMLAARLPRWLQLALCGVALMAATVVVNLAPTNPYLAESLSTWRRGHLFNFNGLTRLLSEAWPFMALAYAFALSAARGRQQG
jgi:VanZ family protein